MSMTEIKVEPGKHEIIMIRELDAPLALVYRAFTDPQAIPHWWGPRYLTTTVEQMDVRPGGQWRFVQRAPGGSVHAFHGVYHAVTPDRGTVQTFEYEGVPGHVAMETLVLEDLGDRTRVIEQSVFQSVADRDGMVAEGMELGVRESTDRMAELLLTMGAPAGRNR
ncbi:MAG: SRPBCC family protein [Chloroflexi bacterium]|nr:SRPBCC family protein [Chloroflexota bacterium]